MATRRIEANPVGFSNPTQTTLERLALETRAHIRRVQELALVIYQERYADSGIISMRDVSMYMKLHDSPKLMSLTELKSWGYSGQRTILERLAKHYGMGDSQELLEIREELNALEEEIKTTRLSRFSKEQLDLLQVIERIADVTDTAKHRSAELNFEPKVLGGAKYLSDSGDEHLAPISEFIETTYLS